MADAALIDAAKFERDRRAERYPAAIREGRITPERASIDFHCWAAIAEWLETDRFAGFEVAIPPPPGEGSREAAEGPAAAVGMDGPPTKMVSWPELEAAAARGLASVAAKAAAEPANLALGVRAARLSAIHRKVQLRAQSIAILNADLRARAGQAKKKGIAA